MADYSTSFTSKNKVIVRALVSVCAISKASKQSGGFTKRFTGIWDTGATNTVITKNVVDALELKPVGKTNITHANGKATVNVYFVNIILPNNVEVHSVKVTEGALGEEADVLIGMDIITLGDFAVTNFEGKTTFSFRVPSRECIDFVKEYKTINVDKKTGRNSLCPCGSEKK